ncbi:MAG: hypothetical protein ACYC91_07045 [Solirubrobacteraceae bacterium]
MTRLLLVVVAWRLAHRLAATALVIALAAVAAVAAVHSGPSARYDGRHTIGAVARVVRPVEQDLQQALAGAFRR